MKRVVSILLMVTLLMGSITVHAETLEELKKDIKSVETISTSTLKQLKTEMKKGYKDFDDQAWYAEYMAKLVGVGGINGYTNGTVKPNGTITRAEFTKILIASLYGEEDTSSIHWAWNYKEKAEHVRILSNDEFKVSDLDEPITRQEMAKMIVLAAEEKYREKSTILDNVDSVIKDIKNTNSKYQDYVRIAYSKGIIGGYPDKTFRPLGNATRAEASTMLVRLLDDSQRVAVKIEEPQEGKMKGGADGLTETQLQLTESVNNFVMDNKIPAMSVLVFKENNIVYESYLGYANVEKGIELTEDHVFLMASISKTVTGTAIMKLYEQGLFDLDDPINDYLPFEVTNPYSDRAITFEMLLNHTSSIADGEATDDQYYYMEDSPVALEDFMEMYFTPEMKYYNSYDNFYDFEPGQEHEYSNMGSALLGVLVEEISGQPFDDYCREYLFEPLGMDNTYWHLEEMEIMSVVVPYDEDLEPIEHYTFTDYPNGGLRTSGRDYMKFLEVFCNDSISNQIISQEIIDEMLSPSIPSIDKTVGLHFFLMDEKRNLWGHDGGEEGVSTYAAFNRDSKMGVIVLCNKSDMDLDDLGNELFDLVLKNGTINH